jgi:hypothetical protein
VVIDLKKHATKTVIEAGVDPTEICSGCGQPLSDHNLKCRVTATGPKGGKGTCEFCGGPAHNGRDKYQLQQFWCLWQLVFGDEASNTPVDAANLRRALLRLETGIRLAPDKPFKTARHPAAGIGERLDEIATRPVAEPGVTPVPVATPSESPGEPTLATGAPPKRRRSAKEVLAKLGASGGVR